jgi:hypothetical protein
MEHFQNLILILIFLELPPILCRYPSSYKKQDNEGERKISIHSHVSEVIVNYPPFSSNPCVSNAEYICH